MSSATVDPGPTVDHRRVLRMPTRRAHVPAQRHRAPLAPAVPDVAVPAPDRDEFVRRILREHGTAMTAYARRLTGNADTADDLVQEALIRTWRHADRLDEKIGSIRGWLLTVLRNLDVDRRRAGAARPQEHYTPEGVPGLENAEDLGRVVDLRTVEDRIVLDELLAHLPVAERRVMEELYLRDRTVTEAARVLRVPAGTVKSRSFYALRRLRELVATPIAAPLAAPVVA